MAISSINSRRRRSLPSQWKRRPVRRSES
jgi:hypothetical protein